MPCFRPWIAHGVREFDSNFGRHVFRVLPGGDIEQQLPCGKCVGCLQARASSWSVRLSHHAQMIGENLSSFLTLTYDDDHLPPLPQMELQLGDFQDFIWKVRREFERPYMKWPRQFTDTGRYSRAISYAREQIQYLHVGEYGGRLGRPHYHVILFGVDWFDKYPWRQRGPYMCYRSPTLERIWGRGNCEIGSVTVKSAAYVAMYVLSKMDERVYYDGYTGEVVFRRPEYCTMSRRPGLGKSWLLKHWREVYRPNDGFIVIDGRRSKSPRYYDKLMVDISSLDLATVVEDRVLSAAKREADNTPERLAVREQAALAKRKARDIGD